MLVCLVLLLPYDCSKASADAAVGVPQGTPHTVAKARTLFLLLWIGCLAVLSRNVTLLPWFEPLLLKDPTVQPVTFVPTSRLGLETARVRKRMPAVGFGIELSPVVPLCMSLCSAAAALFSHPHRT